VPVDINTFDGAADITGGRAGLDALAASFDTEHSRLFSFLLEGNEHELVSARATVTGPRPDLTAIHLPKGGPDPSAALRRTSRIWVDGAHADAAVYERTALQAGNVVTGPAVITEMDSTTLVLPGHAATVHPSGSLLIRPLEG
jgi:N-methylhydantoinase A